MTTINLVGNGLSGSTGSGNFIGANTPILITPNIGAATGTSLALSSQPAFIAYISSDQGNVTGNGAVYTVHFDSTLANVGTCFNTSTYTFTAPTTGFYLLTAAFGMYNITSAMTEGYVSLVCTGQTYTQIIGSPAAIKDVGSQLPCAISRTVKMTANDTCSVAVAIYHGAANSAATQSAAANTHFSGFFLG
jgi:hypothetical protein